MSIDTQQRRNTTSRRCTATCADGSPCQAWAVHGSDPPRCAPHGGGRTLTGAPLGNQNARKHRFHVRTSPLDGGRSGACTIDGVIADLHRQQQRLSRYIDEHIDELEPSELIRFLRVHGQSCSCLGRLLRDRQALGGGFQADMEELTRQALAELSEEWGVDLTG